MLHEILKQATRKQHENLEKLMFVDQIMDGTLSLEQYKQLLLTNYTAHACLEEKLFTGLDTGLQQELELQKRIKLPALAKDLEELELNWDQPELMCDSYLNELLNNNAAILGAMYVLEGATLGGSVIVRRLKVNPNLENLNLNFNYYQAYGADLGPNWKQFLQVLNTKVGKEDYDKTLQSALATFDYLANVQSAHQNVPQF